jgi:NADH:ubiquinone oxidoreductase subunit 5 (subunit L)/multisubunit Na+/H+ antiporter MnhA subunit
MLFLSAGTVIEATHHEEDIRRLGGLRTKLPMANAFFMLGSLALIGTPVITSGSFSKDAILEAALHSQAAWLGWVLLGSVVITGAYAGRLYAGVFLGKPGASSEHAHAPSFAKFDAPLLPLALGAVLLGYTECFTHLLSGFLKPTMRISADLEVHFVSMLGLQAFALGVVGFGLGVLIARTKEKSLPLPPASLWHALWGEVRALPEGVAALHGGRVGRYALLSVLGVAVVVARALAPTPISTPATAPKTARVPATRPTADQPATREAPATNARPNDRADRLRRMLDVKKTDALGKALGEQRKKVQDRLDNPERGKPGPGGRDGKRPDAIRKEKAVTP